MTLPFVVAVDGPGGVGKSTISRMVADRIDAAHLDTGAFYRAATLAVLEAGADTSDQEAVVAVVAESEIGYHDGITLLDSRDVSSQIRTERVNETVSTVSAHPELRDRMVWVQRGWVDGRGGRAVVEGRDIGSVVFPDAAVKVYLDADPQVRAARRSGETNGDPAAVAGALQRRDTLDSNRVASPLTVAADATVIDTTHLDIEAVVAQVMALVDERLSD